MPASDNGCGQPDRSPRQRRQPPGPARGRADCSASASPTGFPRLRRRHLKHGRPTPSGWSATVAARTTESGQNPPSLYRGNILVGKAPGPGTGTYDRARLNPGLLTRCRAWRLLLPPRSTSRVSPGHQRLQGLVLGDGHRPDSRVQPRSRPRMTRSTGSAAAAWAIPIPPTGRTADNTEGHERPELPPRRQVQRPLRRRLGQVRQEHDQPDHLVGPRDPGRW